MGIINHQIPLIENHSIFPSTRFQGSKLKIVDWIWEAIRGIDFSTALDAFGGTGSVGYLLKQKGKEVFYNDKLKFNWFIGLALIENDSVRLTSEDVDFILKRHNTIEYKSFIAENFADIYFADHENEWLDMVITNIDYLDNIYKKAIAYFAVFQSCIIKRPFNLFHRKNLYIRFSDVQRNFGNKTTWDTPFDTHFKKFVAEANAGVFANGKKNRALNCDVFDLVHNFDLVYIDTPYISGKGVGLDYLNFYHFLEGMVNYQNWGNLIDYNSKNKRLKSVNNVWTDKEKIYTAFDMLFEKFKNSILVVSYRADGIPSVQELINILKKYKKNVEEHGRRKYKYVLSTNQTEEILLIGR